MLQRFLNPEVLASVSSLDLIAKTVVDGFVSGLHRSLDYVFVDERMESVMQKFEHSGAWNLPVLDHESRYLGFVSRSRIFSAYREQLSQVSHE